VAAGRVCRRSHGRKGGEGRASGARAAGRGELLTLGAAARDGLACGGRCVRSVAGRESRAGL